jgi:hypothetical protein
MASKTRKQYPSIKGLTWHRHQYYSFFTPMDWHPFSWPDDREGEIQGPDLNDPFTVFAVSLQDLGTQITSDDLDVVAEGFFESIDQLPNVQIETCHQAAKSKMLQLEAKYTFLDGDIVRKRWIRVFYHVTRQITMTAQGATPEKYDYWLPIFFQAMMTAKIHISKPSLAIFD